MRHFAPESGGTIVEAAQEFQGGRVKRVAKAVVVRGVFMQFFLVVTLDRLGAELPACDERSSYQEGG
jgi:hypothetical protein